MTTPVSFPLAKFLKEKGFNEQTLAIYQDGEILWLKSTISNKEFMTSRNYSAPTIAEVVMWVYEKHGIWITSEPCIVHNGITNIYKIFKDDYLDTISRASKGYDSPTEAYEAAITHVLTNLI